jgi:hypothetical protein
MSSKKVAGASVASTSASANPATPASLTPAQVQEWSFALKKLEDNKWIVPAVITAGVAAALEIIHLLFLAVRFMVHLIQGTWSF